MVSAQPGVEIMAGMGLSLPSHKILEDIISLTLLRVQQAAGVYHIGLISNNPASTP